MKESAKKQFFFKHPEMNFETLIALGACDYGAGESGEIFSTVSRIKDGDFESWFSEWLKTAERVRAIGKKAAGDSRPISAADAFLRAAKYFAATNTMVDGSDDPSRLLPVWEEHRDCFERFAALLSPPAVKVSIPYEETVMPGYLFLPEKGPGPGKAHKLEFWRSGALEFWSIVFPPRGHGKARKLKHMRIEQSTRWGKYKGYSPCKAA